MSARIWSVIGIIAAVCGIVFAFVPGGPPGAVLGGVGIVAAVMALRLRGNPVVAVLALVASGVAIALVAAMALVPHRTSCDSVAVGKAWFGDHYDGFGNADAGEVRAKMLSVRFGDVSTAADDPGLLLTLTNQMPIAMVYSFTVVASGADGVPVAQEQHYSELLGAGAEQSQRVLARDVTRLSGATFELTGLQARPLSPVECGPEY